MINLLSNKEGQIKNNTLEINLDSQNSENYNLDFKSLPCDNLIINLSNNSTATILNIVHHSNKHIIFNLRENSHLTFNIASFDEENHNQVVVNMDDDSEFKGAYADFSSGDNEFKFDCHLNGRGARATWHLASLLKNEDKKSFEISFYHHNRETYAKMENYGVCEDSSNLSFLGTNKIIKGAHNSATHQSAKIMVFDKKCVAKASPTLCIDENDVQASHAAVVGKINEDHIFYLTSRGIEEKEAKKLITLGYLMPILSHFNDQKTIDDIKENIERRV